MITLQLWIATLRMTGLGLLALVVIGTVLLIQHLQSFTIVTAYSFILGVVGALALALICLGTAAALDLLRLIEARTRGIR